MAPTVKIDNPSSHNYSLPGNASRYPGQIPNVPIPSIVFHAQEPGLPLLLQQQQQQPETSQKQGLAKENESEIARQKMDMLSRYMQQIKGKKNLHLMSICIKTFELSVQNRKLQMELDELREQTKTFLDELKGNSVTINLKNPIGEDLPQQAFSINSEDMSPLPCPTNAAKYYSNAINPPPVNIPNVNFLANQNNPLRYQQSSFNQPNFENSAHLLPSILHMKTNMGMMIPTTVEIPVSTFPLNGSGHAESMGNHPSSIYRDVEIEKQIQDQNPSDNSNDSSSLMDDDVDDDADGCSFSTSNINARNGEITQNRAPIRGEDKKMKNKNISNQLQQQNTQKKISPHKMIQNNMSKYLDLISRKPTRRTRGGSISSNSTSVSFNSKKSLAIQKQTRMKRKTLSLRPSSPSSFSSCSDLNLSQCSSPVSPFFSSWSTNDEFEDVSDNDMNDTRMRPLRIEI